jgi:hypothetical protein
MTLVIKAAFVALHDPIHPVFDMKYEKYMVAKNEKIRLHA